MSKISSSVTVDYNKVLADANYVSYKTTKERIIDATYDDTATDGSITLSYEEVLKEANDIAFRDGKKWISVASSQQDTFVGIDTSKILSSANFEAYRFDKRHIVEFSDELTAGTVSINLTEVKNEVNTTSWNVLGRSVDEGGVSAFAISIDKVRKEVDAISWKVAQCRVDDIEKRFEAQSDDDDTTFISQRIDEAANKLVAMLPNARYQTDTKTIELGSEWSANNSVTALVQKYIVDAVLYEWFKMVMPDEAAIYLASSSETSKQILGEVVSKSWIKNQFDAHVAELADMFDIHLINSSYDEAKSTQTFSLRFSPTWRGNINVFSNYVYRYIVDSILNSWFAIASPATTSFADSAAKYATLISGEVSSDDNSTLWYEAAKDNAIAHLCGELSLYATYAGGLFTFNLKEEWRGSMAAIKEYIHQYIVDYILYRWFLTINNDKASSHLQLSQAWIAKIKEEAESVEDASEWFNNAILGVAAILKDELRPLLRFNGEKSNSTSMSLLLNISNTWRGSMDSLREYVRRYAVSYVLSKWFTITDSSKASKYAEEASLWKDRIIAEAFSEDENTEWFSGVYATAVEQLVDRLAFCMKQSDEDANVLNFTFSNNWRGSMSVLANYIHRYIVDYILFEWFSMTFPDKSANYLASAESWKSKIVNEARSEDVSNVFFRL